jgi:hypothetical protein
MNTVMKETIKVFAIICIAFICFMVFTCLILMVMEYNIFLGISLFIIIMGGFIFYNLYGMMDSIDKINKFNKL